MGQECDLIVLVEVDEVGVGVDVFCFEGGCGYVCFCDGVFILVDFDGGRG